MVACVRPAALADAVTFGKGRTPMEAEVGARMEALEFYYAEPGRSAVEPRLGDVEELDDHAGGGLEAFIPLRGTRVTPGQKIGVVAATELEGGAATLVPAELAFRPAPALGKKLFGASTNGLASGNSLEEASRCSLMELIERDVWSLELARQRSRLVAPDSLPGEVRVICEQVHGRGLGLHVRAVPNDYGFPFFSCFLHDPEDLRLSTFNGGWGCAFRAEDAVMQAVMEAAQGRLGMLHGGRTARAPEGQSPEDVTAALRKQIERVSDASRAITFSDVKDRAAPGSDGERLDDVVSVLGAVCPGPIHRVVFTPDDAPLQVTRLLVPGLEHYRVGQARVGRRLHDALKAAAAEGRVS